MQTLITDLWNQQQLPIRTGIYFANGDSRQIEIRKTLRGDSFIKAGGEFDIRSWLRRHPDELTNIDIVYEAELTEGGWLFCGEGSYGSEGFFGLLGPDRNLNWVAYMENSNPIVQVNPLRRGICAISNIKKRYFLHTMNAAPANWVHSNSI